MNEFLKMDIFFVITAIAVVTLSILAGVVLWRLERVLKNVEYISEQVADESDNVRSDLAELRDDIRKGKGRLESLLGFFGKRSRRARKS